MGLFRSKREVLRCSFCGKPAVRVAKLIGSSLDSRRTYICNECVDVCQRILEDERNQKTGPNNTIKMGLSSIT